MIGGGLKYSSSESHISGGKINNKQNLAKSHNQFKNNDTGSCPNVLNVVKAIDLLDFKSLPILYCALVFNINDCLDIWGNN